MKRSFIETAIGALVLVIAGIFLIYSYQTAHQDDNSIGKSYDLKATFDNVGGLKSGDAVMISGVKIGAVRKIELENKLYRAEVTFSVAENVRLATDSSARISSEGLLGGKYLDLQPGGDEADMAPGDMITITQAPANLEDLLGRFIFSVQDSKKKDGGDSGNADTPRSDEPSDEPATP